MPDNRRSQRVQRAGARVAADARRMFVIAALPRLTPQAMDDKQWYYRRLGDDLLALHGSGLA